MADDNDDWLSAATEEEPPAEQATDTAAAGAPAGEGAPAAEGEGGAPAGEGEAQPKPEEDEYLDPDKLLLFKHWIRPKFLSYRYIQKYRENYYDDVIDYLEKRQKGLSRDVPRPQTWAERALRTYTNRTAKDEFYRRARDDIKLVTTTSISGAFHRYHSKQYINRRYSSYLS
ncbi:flightin [Agrilus planipennis]|uniref:Flightin n=1 Tax=Agrilus planipennis TaxID=224129 RepID=A0A1W4XHC2_AGRPL|nr:flightin [Agrilus planipennis]XP_018332187.1 flightin [Agrilus planipennis]XP_018332188.1 flightin [Agrilus planipennis]